MKPSIIKVKDLLQIKNLQIPDYQRPYKWTDKNVNQLIDDILFHKNKSAYRLGTLVIHNEANDIMNVVDGQQRVITLTLIVHALKKSDKFKCIKSLAEFETNLVSTLSFSLDISKANIQSNFRAIERRINEFDEDIISFFFNECELVQVQLTDISEAFQFFDSQNARGKDLEPHDLLKAFHLREMTSVTENERIKTIENWEAMETSELSKLFSHYLYRIKNWSDGKSAKYFTKDEVDIFKGLSPQIEENYPFAKLYRIAHLYTENYNRSYHSTTDKNSIDYPFQIDQPIINGKYFFEMVTYYGQLIAKIKKRDHSLLNIIKSYPGCYRTGDKYVINLFYCGLIYYMDKFGEQNLEKAITKIFIWAYTLRLKLYSVGLDSTDNYALDKSHSQIQLFKKIRASIDPKGVLNIRLEVLQQKTLKRDIPEIVQVFIQEKYYDRDDKTI